MKYYTSHSWRGNSSSHGFANDTVVLIWEDYQSMQNFLKNYSNISAKRIKRSEATKYADNFCMSTNASGAPDRFKGEFWGIDHLVECIDANHTRAEEFDGLYGELLACCAERSHYERFYTKGSEK
jgi:hypothetical protein